MFFSVSYVSHYSIIQSIKICNLIHNNAIGLICSRGQILAHQFAAELERHSCI